MIALTSNNSLSSFGGYRQLSGRDGWLASSGRYAVSLAVTDAEIDEALRLRYRVFNLEMGQGLAESGLTGRDEDEFDRYFDHLIVRDLGSQKVVGTYRLQTAEMAAKGAGFYSNREFDLSMLPSGILENGIELGRACVAAEARNTRVLFLLWSGLAQYLALRGKRYFFGCCSLSGVSREMANSAFQVLKENGLLLDEFLVSSRAGSIDAGQGESLGIGLSEFPPLFRAYLRNGARVCSEPSVDHLFGTVDFLILYDRAAGTGRYGLRAQA